MAAEAIIHRWHTATSVHSISFQAEKTAMEKAISWLDENEDWRKALFIYDSKSLVDSVGNSRAPDEGIRLCRQLSRGSTLRGVSRYCGDLAIVA